MGSVTKIEVLEDEEVRFKVENGGKEPVQVELVRGRAEIFGAELVSGQKYNFPHGSNVSIYTFHGCSLNIIGQLDQQPENVSANPVVMYLNIHAVLERLRKLAEQPLSTKSDKVGDNSGDKVDEEKGDNSGEVGRGPTVLVVGPTDVGKSTLCKMLLNFGVRMGRRPIFVDLDVGQGNLSVPGTIAACLVEKVTPISTGEFEQNVPLVYNYGFNSPGHNPNLYKRLVSRMAEIMEDRLQSNSKTAASGVIINTSGWCLDEGYTQLKHIAQEFEVDVVVVMDQQRLYKDLKHDLPHFIKVIWLPKSSGVQVRTKKTRMELRNLRIRKYFYGQPETRALIPYSFDLKFFELKDRLYKVNAATGKSDEFKAYPVSLTARTLQGHLLAISYATEIESLALSNVAGFICVTSVDEANKKITVLSPQPHPLPQTLLLYSDVTCAPEQFSL